MARPREHTPEKILAAALLAFRAEGVSVSTATVAKTAGISIGTLFNHFRTKQAMIDALYLGIKADLAAAIGLLDNADPVEHRIRQVWDRWFEWASNKQDAHVVMTLLYHAGLPSPEAQAIGLEALHGPIAVLEEAMETGLLVDLPMEYLGALVEQQLDQAVMAGLDDGQADIAFSVLWGGITTTAPKKRTHKQSATKRKRKAVSP